MLDVDSKDTTVGMSCPPDNFLTADFLSTLKQALLPQGEKQIVVLVNL